MYTWEKGHYADILLLDGDFWVWELHFLVFGTIYYSKSQYTHVRELD